MQSFWQVVMEWEGAGLQPEYAWREMLISCRARLVRVLGAMSRPYSSIRAGASLSCSRLVYTRFQIRSEAHIM